MPSRVPRSIADEEFNEIFARLPSHRDRALVAFYVSTGARASELLSATLAGVDPGRQVITVVRKGSRELRELPASADAFVWLRLYQVRDGRADPEGAAAAAVVDAAPAVRPLTYHAVHRMFERAGQAAGSSATLHSLRHTAAYRMAEDPALPLTDVQLVLGHALLTTTQIYLTPRKEEVIRRVLAHHAGQTRQAAAADASAAGARLPARDDEGAVRGPDLVTEVIDIPATAAAALRAQRQAARHGSRRARRPRHGLRPGRSAVRCRSGSPAGSSPAQRRRPGQAEARAVLAAGLARRPAGPDLAGTLAGQRCRRRGRRLAADTGAWQRECGRDVRAGCGAVRSAGSLICADVVRPSLSWLVASRAPQGTLSRDLARTRDPEGFARLAGTVTPTRRIVRRRKPHAAAQRLDHRRQRRHASRHHRRRRAGAAGPPRRRSAGPGGKDHKVFYRMLRELGSSATRRPARLREFRTAGQLTPARAGRPLPARMPAGP